MPSLPVKIGIVIAGLILYFFAISALLNIRRDKSQQRVLFDSIDYNRDGILTTQQINTFQPCSQSNKTTLITRLHTLGPRVTYDQFENDVSRNMIKSTIAPCAANAHLFSNPTQLSKRSAQMAVGPFFRLYDLDQDGIITWNEYNLVNKYHGKTIKGSSDTFAFIDRNNDWEINRQQFLAANLKQLDPQLVASSQTSTQQGAGQADGGYRSYNNDPYASPNNRDPYYDDPIDRGYNDPYVEPVSSRQRASNYRSTEPNQQSYRQTADPYYEPTRARRYQNIDSRPRRQVPASGYSQRQQRYYDQGL